MNELPKPVTETPLLPQNQRPPEQSKRLTFISLFAVAILAIGTGGFLLGRLTSPEAATNESAITTPEDWRQLPSGKKGFPLPNQKVGPLQYYSVESEKIVTVDSVKVGATGSGAIGIGNNSPVASPDLHYIAYIGEDNNLWVFSNETEEAMQLTTNGFVSYITGWSPDSKSILYYYDHKTIANSMVGIDMPSVPDTLSFKPQTEKGFYVTNIENGKVTPLAAIEYVERFIDNNTLLVKSDAESTRLIAFNIDSLEADLSLIKLEAGFGVGQFNFTNNADWWTYLVAMDKANPTKGESRIVLGAYPAEAATVVDSGSWASVQWPMFSPNNKKIVYQKRTPQENGTSKDRVWVFNIESGERTDLVDGYPVHWVDDKTVLVRNPSKEGQSEPSFSLLTVESRRMTSIE